MSQQDEEKRPDDIVMWVRLPRPMKVEELKKIGLDSAACYGGDTCIAATTTTGDAGIVVHNDLEKALKDAGLAPQAACFGGDTCIV